MRIFEDEGGEYSWEKALTIVSESSIEKKLIDKWYKQIIEHMEKLNLK